MFTMKRRTAVTVTAGVWALGLASAGALAFVLNRPLPPVAMAEPQVAAADHPAMMPVAAEPAADPPVLHVSAFTVVGRPPHRAPVARREKPSAEPSPLHCAEWRDLDMGSGHVQVCD